jgi:hypothetical protein
MRSIPGYHQTQRNFSLLENLMKKFDQDKEQPFPLSNVNIKDKTLFLIDTKSRTFKAIRHLTPLLAVWFSCLRTYFLILIHCCVTLIKMKSIEFSF